MYWIFLIFFIITILIPDIVRTDLYSISETRIEEFSIFFMGALAFIIFLKNEQQLIFHKKEKEKDQKKIEQTVKDLVESYSYIGEVNRKIDLLTQVALGFSDRSILTKTQEKEIYQSIIKASNSLFKADFSSLHFVDVKTGKTKKEIYSDSENQKNIFPKKDTLLNILKKEESSIIKEKNYLIGFSSSKINNIKSFIIVSNYDKQEETDHKNGEILKVFASQALFLYSYIKINCNCNKNENN
ncbi:MAG: hypothetical protein COT31_02970 [Candidatus Moranbacteria bacterium CG08_land_8_20_14_0_20_34_16]|nr:MAG: hypothetical protein COT31_02970 [Candidatus Moranbacteria bacterium CG08_land_8_20_14_0_20_34_16]